MEQPRARILSAVLAAAALMCSLPVFSQALTQDEGAAIAEEAYVYGYPLVTMEMTQRIMTNVREEVGSRAPTGHLIRLRAYPTAAFKDVTAPNADTLDTTAWIDVGKEPWILSLPDAHDRYYLFPMLDGWTDLFQVPGKRTTGTDYLQRALVTTIGLGANRFQDAVYPTSEVDAQGRACRGANTSVMHFPQGQMPPVNGFYSLTMNNAEYFFYGNELNRDTLSARDDLKKNADGPVDFYLQHENPGHDKESNWPPAPSGKFILMLRLYWPTETPSSIIDGTWKIPAVQIVN